MSGCPSWQRLVSVREARQGEDPPGWNDAMGHARDCPSCAEEALRADSTLLFQRLPAPELDDLEIDAIKRSVKAMRSGSRLAPKSPPAWLRWAAAAMVVGTLGSLQGGPFVAPRIEQVVERADEIPAGFEPDVVLGDLPLVEEADPAFGPILQLENEVVSVVLVRTMGGAEGVS